MAVAGFSGRIMEIVAPGPIGGSFGPPPPPPYKPPPPKQIQTVTGVQPIHQGFYIPLGHSLVLTYTSAQFSYNFVVTLRYALMDGTIIITPLYFNAIGQAYNQIYNYPMPECYLLGIVAQNFMSDQGQGHVYIACDLYQPTYSHGTLVQRLVANYATNDSFLFWPGGPSAYSDQVPHNEMQNPITMVNPQNRFIVPINNGQFAKLNGIQWQWTTSAVAGNRSFKITTFQGDVLSRPFYSSMTIPASTTVRVVVLVGNRAEQQVGGDWFFYVDAGYVGGPCNLAEVDIINSQAGDVMAGPIGTFFQWLNVD